MRKLLLYNGIDSLMEYRLAVLQKLSLEGMERRYSE
jgi:hypothetical protein